MNYIIINWIGEFMGFFRRIFRRKKKAPGKIERPVDKSKITEGDRLFVESVKKLQEEDRHPKGHARRMDSLSYEKNAIKMWHEAGLSKKDIVNHLLKQGYVKELSSEKRMKYATALVNSIIRE